jgi:hypothetical protein
MTFFLWIPINVQYFSVSYWCHNRSKQRNRCADRACNLQQAWSVWPDKSTECLHSYKGKCDFQLLESPPTSQSHADSDSASIVLQRYRVKKCSKAPLGSEGCHMSQFDWYSYIVPNIYLSAPCNVMDRQNHLSLDSLSCFHCRTLYTLHTYINLTEHLYDTNN